MFVEMLLAVAKSVRIVSGILSALMCIGITILSAYAHGLKLGAAALLEVFDMPMIGDMGDEQIVRRFSDMFDVDIWSEYVNLNRDKYGKRVIDFARTWAYEIDNMMRVEGKPLSEVAEDAREKANVHFPVDKYQLGCAVATLYCSWKYGDILRKWFNLAYQLESEGELANQYNGVINPALLIPNMMRRRAYW